MYNQWKYHRLFWRLDHNDDGVDYEQSQPITNNVMKNDFYVDDYLTGNDSQDKLVEI